MSTRWIVIDGSLWPRLPDLRRREIKAWLRMNGIEPRYVPVDSSVTLDENENGDWKIFFEQYRRSDEGNILVDPKNPYEAFVELCAVPLEIDPPQEWLIPCIPEAA